MPRQTILLAALTLSVCSAEPSASDAETSGITTVVDADGLTETTGLSANTVTSATPSPISDAGSSTGAGSGKTDDVFTTTGTPPDFDTGGVGCGGKIDLVFILERDESMWDQQAALAVSLPKFLQTIESMFDDFDLHIMVVNADVWNWGIDECVELCAVNEGQGCAPEGPEDYPCWAYSENALDECDEVSGAGVTFPAGFGSANERCELYGGNRYIIGDEPNLAAAFECITNLGMTNENQALAGLALQHTFSPQNLAPGGCNEGFVRDDALLVVTIVTDNVGYSVPGTPTEWAAPVFAAKGDDENAIVMLGLSPDQHFVEEPLCGPYFGDYVPPHDELFSLFPNLVRASVCEDDYSPFFGEAASLVLEACESFIPQ